ncbi:MAG: thioredoxin family protein, partial [Nitrospirota bacterium]
FPLCFDETQEIAKAYRAACTPDFYLFDRERRLAYHGQLDDSRPGSSKLVTGHDLRAAIDAVLTGQPVDSNQKASIGCSIKWKRGME